MVFVSSKFLSIFYAIIASSIVSIGYGQIEGERCRFKETACVSDKAEVGRKYKNGQILCSKNGKYQFGILKDRSALVLCKNNRQVWSEELNTNGFDVDAKVWFTQHENGSLTVMGRNRKGNKEKLWVIRRKEGVKGTFVVSNDGKAEFLSVDGNTLWRTPSIATDSDGDGGGDGDGNNGPSPVAEECKFRKDKNLGTSMARVSYLRQGEYLSSLNGVHELGVPKTDDMLSLCKNGQPVWTKTVVDPVLRLQNDGNLILASEKSHQIILKSTTQYKNVGKLIVRDGGKVHLVNKGGQIVWSLQDNWM